MTGGSGQTTDRRNRVVLGLSCSASSCFPTSSGPMRAVVIGILREGERG